MESKKYTKGALLLFFLKGSIGFFAVSILSSLAVSLLEMLIPQIIRVTVDNVLGSADADLPAPLLSAIERAGGFGWFRDHLFVIALLVAFVGILLAVFRYMNMYFNSKGAETMMKKTRDSLFSHIQHLPYEWHMRNKTGDIIQRCTSDVDMIRNFIAEQMTGIFRIVAMMTMSLVFMFGMDPSLAVIPCVFIPVVISYSTYFHNRIHARFLECDENEGILSTIAQENLTGVRVVRAFGREDYERKRFEKQNVKYTNLWVRLCALLSVYWGAGDLTGALQVMLVVVIGASRCVNGPMTSGEFIAFISYNAMLTWPIRQLGRMISEMSKAGVSIERIRYIMNSPCEHDAPDARECDMNGDIVFDRVSFGYTKDKQILHDVSFTVKKGTVFGILGGTGSGKSTLMYLLDRLYDLPEGSGTITVNGVDIRKIPLACLRGNIGMVLQEPFLFSRTIRENIAIAREGATEEEVTSAAEVACIDSSIREFAKGYETEVGERGVTLSGGQKQRTAIARMVIQKTPIMIFDDSLSAVDAETDSQIRRALGTACKGSTVILIAHRVTTLMAAEHILVLDKGRVLEEGSPEELLERGGLFRRVYDMQMSLDIDGKEETA